MRVFFTKSFEGKILVLYLSEYNISKDFSGLRQRFRSFLMFIVFLTVPLSKSPPTQQLKELSLMKILKPKKILANKIHVTVTNLCYDPGNPIHWFVTLSKV